MKKLKRLIIVLVCVVLLSNCFSFNALMVDSFDEGDYLYTLEDLIDMGAYSLYDGSYFLPDSFEFPSLFLTSNKHFSSFDINKVNWALMPDYIQDVVYMGISDLSKNYDASPDSKVPFVMVNVYNSTYFRVYVGVNVGLGVLNDANGSVGIYTRCWTYDYEPVKNTAYDNSFLYSALFNISDYSLASDWTLIPQNRFDNVTSSADVSQPYIFRYFTYNIFNLMSGIDLYLYGANYVSPVGSAGGSFNFPLNNNSSSILSMYHSRDGFVSGNYFFNQLQYDAYVQTFFPKTVEQFNQELQQEQNDLIEDGNKTSKSIWETLKSIPSQIGTFFDNLKNYLLYFQSTQPEHVNPFAGILDGIQSFFDDQIADTDKFKNSLDTTFTNVSGYIQTGSNVVNSLLDGVPVLNTVVIFLLAFAVIRKVVGR